jgi:bacterioferritin
MHEKSIDYLNKAVADELAAIHQYMYFHFHCDDQGFDLLASLFKKTAMEEQSAKEYNEWANECGANADSATKRIFEDLVADEERHYDQFATEMENMDRFGDRYLALQSIERSKSLSTPSAE